MRPYIIRVSSQKGGVGKTTISVNLAVSLHMAGYDTLLIDADTTTPSVGFHLGLEKVNKGYVQMANGSSKIRDLVSTHAPSGMHVIPGTINSKPFLLSKAKEGSMFSKLKKSPYRFIVIDTPPGYGDLVSGIDNALLVTVPDMPSFSSVVRLSKKLDKIKVKHTLVVNRSKNKRYEIHPKEIRQTYEGKLLSIIPEDEIVPESIEAQIPAVLIKKRSRFLNSMRDVMDEYVVNSKGQPPVKKRHMGILSIIIGLFRRTPSS